MENVFCLEEESYRLVIERVMRLSPALRRVQRSKEMKITMIPSKSAMPATKIIFTGSGLGCD